MLLTRTTIEIVNKINPRPKFFVVCGDLVDAQPGQYNREEQVKHFKNCFNKLSNDIPLVCVCGNYDVGNNPPDHSVGDDYYTFCYDGVLFIVLSIQLYKEGKYVQELASSQDEWVEKVIKNARL